MVLYRGLRRRNGCTDLVRFAGRSERWLLREHGRPGVMRVPWDWGDDGGGALETAFALLRDIGLSHHAAEVLSPALRAEVVASLDRGGWALSSDELYSWLCDTVSEALASEDAELYVCEAIYRRAEEGPDDE